MAENKPTVERDENGVPTSWLLVRAGPTPLRKNGEDYVLELTSKDLSGIVNYQRTSGEKIPIDSNHYLHLLAQKHGIEETDALKIIPSGVAAMGFGTLECRADGTELWIKAEWLPNAYEFLKEKIFRYFSPVFRGLKEGPVRITSVAMENEPAIKNLDALAATAGGGDEVPCFATAQGQALDDGSATLREATTAGAVSSSAGLTPPAQDDAACGAYLEIETTKHTKGRSMNMTQKPKEAGIMRYSGREPRRAFNSAAVISLTLTPLISISWETPMPFTYSVVVWTTPEPNRS